MATIREILVMAHTHHDIGYTHTPSACLEAHEAAVGEAIRLAEAAQHDDSPTAFRWTFEISRPVLQYLRHAPADEVRRLQELVAADRLAVTGGYLHMTQLVGHEEALRAFWPIHELRERYGLPVTIVQHGDINGLGWGTVPLMAAAGLDTLVMALNPDHGRPPFEQPSAFHWEGPDGSRVLVWLNLHYGFADLAEEGTIDSAREVIPPLLARTAERTDYPFDFLIVHAARDNMWPDGRAVNAARLWNEEGCTPPMRVVTIETAMAKVREQAARVELPVVRGEWSDWWAHGHGSSAYEVGIGREARAELRAAETAHAVRQVVGQAPKARPGGIAVGPTPPLLGWYGPPIAGARRGAWSERVDAAYDDLLLWEEHTWGAGESVTKPFSQVTHAHWNEKAGFGYRAHATARELQRDAVQGLIDALPAGDEPALVVVNPLSRRRDELVTVTSRTGTTTRLVRDLPPLGVTVVPLHDETSRPPERATVIENRFYRVEVDPATASVTSLIDKETGKEWVDAGAASGIAGVVYEVADPADDHPAITTSRRHFHPDTPGPRFVRTAATGTGEGPTLERAEGRSTLIWEGKALFLPVVRTTITLYDDLKWIDIDVYLRKEENYEMEGVYVVFPFALERPEFHLETTGAVFRAGIEQLPDTCHDWYSVQHAIGVTDGESSVLWATREAPLVQLGGFRAGHWAREFRPESGHIYAWLMNNLYFTNFKAAQGGQFDFAFRLTTAPGGVDPSAVRSWGESFAARPVALIDAVAPGEFHWLDIGPETVIAQVVTPVPRSHDDGIVIRLRETAGQVTTATVAWRAEGEIEVGQTGIFGEVVDAPVAGDGRTFTFSLRPFDLASIMIRRR
ncbi:MAG: hypothetical protein H0V37_07270 [Chloroflexia bacterium]|nr:hypothetical protein [Chloroflexia bacterium]